MEDKENAGKYEKEELKMRNERRWNGIHSLARCRNLFSYTKKNKNFLLFLFDFSSVLRYNLERMLMVRGWVECSVKSNVFNSLTSTWAIPSTTVNEVFAALNSCHTSLHISVVFGRAKEKKIFQTLSDREFIVWCVSCTRALHCIKYIFDWAEPCRMDAVCYWELKSLNSWQPPTKLDKSEEKWNFIVFSRHLVVLQQ